MSFLRGKINMGLIKNIDDLKPIINAGKALQLIDKVAAPGQTLTEDGWGKFERVLTGINQLLETVNKMKQENPPPGNLPRQTIADSPQAHYEKAVKELPASTAKSEDGNKLKIDKKVIDFAENHINTCVKENPNMTIGECIGKIPINVTQLSVLLQLIKAKIGG